MHYFCRKQDMNKYAWIIILALVLRSFVAPGFMLDTSSGSGLAIIFCNGPAGLYVPASDYTEHRAHHHSPGDGSGHQNHITPACSDWSTSGMLVFDSYVDVYSLDTGHTVNIQQYATPLFLEFVDSNRSIRFMCCF